MHRVAQSLLIALAVVVFGIAGFVVVHGPNVKGAGTTPRGADMAVQPSRSSDGQSASTNASPQHVVAFVGDDWTTGQGASSASKAFVALTGAALHVDAKAFGANGAGYAHAGAGGKTYADLVTDVLKLQPEVVVVTGGRNDETDDGGTAASAARAFFAELRKDLPHAVLIAVSPWWGDSDLPAQLNALSSAVKSAVHTVGGHYIYISDPLHGHPSDMANDAYPNDRGYSAITRALSPKIHSLLAAS